MNIEYEATFTDIDKDEMRERLSKAGAKLLRPEFKQKRIAFDLPGFEKKGDRFARVRDEGDKITMTLKIFEGSGIADQKEINLTVDSFENAVLFLEKIGCANKSYQETKREVWSLDDAEVTIDTWPFLKPIVEVEGRGEEAVRSVSEKLGFEYSQAKFCSIDVIYGEKYGLPISVINTSPKIIFEMDNPFINNN